MSPAVFLGTALERKPRAGVGATSVLLLQASEPKAGRLAGTAATLGHFLLETRAKQLEITGEEDSRAIQRHENAIDKIREDAFKAQLNAIRAQIVE